MNKPLWSWKNAFSKLGLTLRSKFDRINADEMLERRLSMGTEILEERRMLVGSGIDSDPLHSQIDDVTFDEVSVEFAAPAVAVNEGNSELDGVSVEPPIASESTTPPTLVFQDVTNEPLIVITPTDFDGPEVPTATNPLDSEPPIVEGDPFEPLPPIAPAGESPSHPVGPIDPSEPIDPLDPHRYRNYRISGRFNGS